MKSVVFHILYHCVCHNILKGMINNMTTLASYALIISSVNRLTANVMMIIIWDRRICCLWRVVLCSI